jgi:hypothetical protein
MSLVATLPNFNEGGCTGAGGTLVDGPTSPNGDPTFVCDLSSVIRRPTWLTFGLGVVGALVVGAGVMHFRMKAEGHEKARQANPVGEPHHAQILFRVDRENNVIAVFPYEVATLNGLVVTYEHAGQHGSGDLDGMIKESRPAKPSEYASLLRELRGQGYVVKVIQRANRERVRDALRVNRALREQHHAALRAGSHS